MMNTPINAPKAKLVGPGWSCGYCGESSNSGDTDYTPAPELTESSVWSFDDIYVETDDCPPTDMSPVELHAWIVANVDTTSVYTHPIPGGGTCQASYDDEFYTHTGGWECTQCHEVFTNEDHGIEAQEHAESCCSYYKSQWEREVAAAKATLKKFGIEVPENAPLPDRPAALDKIEANAPSGLGPSGLGSAF